MFKTADERRNDGQAIKAIKAMSTRLDAVLEKLEGDSVSGDLRKVKKELTDKQIEFDREQEKWDREKRETEHMVGLQKKRADQERDLAVRAAQLEVREGNLKSKEDAFEERLEAITDGLKDQVEYLRTDIIKAILERLPTFNVDTMLRQPAAISSTAEED